MAQQTLSATSVVAVTMYGTYQSQRVLNVFHYKNISGNPYVNGDDELNALIDNFKSVVWDPAVGTKLRAQFVAAYTLDAITAQQVAPGRNYYIGRLIAEAGTAAGTGVPSDTNLTMSFRTSRPIRGTTGNKKFTALPLANVSANQWDATIRGNFSALATNFGFTLNDVAMAASWQPTVWSPARSGDRADIVGFLPRDEVRVLRRRQLRLGI